MTRINALPGKSYIFIRNNRHLPWEVRMRIVPVVCAALLLSLVPLAAPAHAKDGCPAGMKRECKPQSYPPKAPPACRCVADPSNQGSGNQGKAEIKKKNVPQAQQNKKPGPND
jgi:hypothetical protein